MTMAEHVVVTKHDPEGRILEFVKTPIGLAAAESLKAQAFVVSERKRERELVRETAALIDKARLPAKTATPLLAPPASPAPRQLAPQSRVARGIQTPEQPPPAARRSPPATRAAKKLTPNELLAKIE